MTGQKNEIDMSLPRPLVRACGRCLLELPDELRCTKEAELLEISLCLISRDDYRAEQSELQSEEQRWLS